MLLALQLILALPAPPVSFGFMYRTIALLPPTAPSSVAFVILSPLSLCTPDTHLLSWRGMSSTYTLPTPTIFQPLPLVSLPCATYPLLPLCPASIFLSCRPCPDPRSLSDPWGFPVVFFSVTLVSAPQPPCVILCLLSYDGVWYPVRMIFAHKG